MALPATDAFTGTNGTALTTYSANWTYNKGTFAIHTNALQCTVDGFDAAAHWNADTFSNDQYSRATVTAIDPLAYIGVAVRCQASAETWYEVIGNSNDATYFYKVVAGSGSSLAATTAPLAVNDVIEIRASGTTISWYKNSTLMQSVTDTSISSGYAGVAGSGNNSGSRIDSWEGGNLSAGGKAIPLMARPLRVWKQRR